MRRLSPARFALAAALALGCNRSPSDLREWTPADHKHQTESNDPNEPSAPRVTGSAEAPLPGLEEVTIAAYRRSCASCHGQLGRGDGPQGPMVKARDLSDPAWQASVTDDQIAEAITKGRGRMPPAGLPAETVTNLVHLVRLFNQNRFSPRPGPSASAAPSAVPPPSAPSPTQTPAPAKSGGAVPKPVPATPQGRSAPSPK